MHRPSTFDRRPSTTRLCAFVVWLFAAVPSAAQPWPDQVARLNAAPALPTTHWLLPNRNGAAADAALLDAAARVSGGIGVHLDDASVAWGLAVQQRTSCKLALLVWHTRGYTFDDAGVDVIVARMRALRAKFPQLAPALIIMHRENETAPLRIMARYYAELHAVWPDVPVTLYGSGWSILHGATAQRGTYPPGTPADVGSFDLYMDATPLMRETIAVNAARWSGRFAPWVALIGAYRDVARSPNSPWSWDRTWRRTADVDRARGFLMLARSLRDLQLHSVVFYPAFPDVASEVPAMTDALIAYSCGWNQVWPPPAPSPTPSPSPTPTPTPAPTPTPTPTPAPSLPPSSTPTPEFPPQTPGSLAPIAQWLTVPGAATETVEVIAFSRPGVWGVVFDAGGVPIIDCTGPIYSAELPAGTIRATVIGTDGGTRVLDPLVIGSGGPRVIRGQHNPAVGIGAVWLDGCTFTTTPQTGGANPLYMTNCTVTGASRGPGPSPNVQMIRGCLFRNLSDDGAQNCPLVVDLTIDGIDPGTSGIHADALQGWGRVYDGWIWYNVAATDLYYQGIFIRSMGLTRGMAIVNCTMQLSGPPTINAFQGEWDHLVLRGCSFTGAAPTDWTYSSDFNLWPESGKFSLTRSDISGNTFASWNLNAVRGRFDETQFKNNRWGTSTAPQDGLP